MSKIADVGGRKVRRMNKSDPRRDEYSKSRSRRFANRFGCESQSNPLKSPHRPNGSGAQQPPRRSSTGGGLAVATACDEPDRERPLGRRISARDGALVIYLPGRLERYLATPFGMRKEVRDRRDRFNPQVSYLPGSSLLAI